MAAVTRAITSTGSTVSCSIISREAPTKAKGFSDAAAVSIRLTATRVTM